MSETEGPGSAYRALAERPSDGKGDEMHKEEEGRGAADGPPATPAEAHQGGAQPVASEVAEPRDPAAPAQAATGPGQETPRPASEPNAPSRVLATQCPGIDRLLDGGLEVDAITLVFGEGGSGKTNLALQCAREAVRAGARVAFVDTEGVSTVRLRQVFGELDIERMLFFNPFSIEEQERMVQNATKAPKLGLVVVDSINMHYRLHMDADDGEREASRSLYKQLHHLTNFARKHRVPVLVTGQVYGGEDTTQPFARRVMEHLVKALVRFEKRPDGTRRATILKHRSIPEGRQASFKITSDGLA